MDTPISQTPREGEREGGRERRAGGRKEEGEGGRQEESEGGRGGREEAIDQLTTLAPPIPSPLLLNFSTLSE